MDKALKNTIGWLICAIIIIAVIYGYYATKKDYFNIQGENSSWIETKGIIKNIHKNTDSEKDTSVNWIVEYTDKDNILRKVKLYPQSAAYKKISDTITLLYNPVNPNKAKFVNNNITETN